jgi:hypothetical protein
MDHISKDLFLVMLKEIAFANDPKKKFSNPRKSLPNKVQGMDEDSLGELRESIKSEGLQNPPTVRIVPGLPKGKTVELIRGERRVCCLLDLVADNAKEMCYDPETRKWVRPKDLYEQIICHVVECDDLMANKIAFSDNDQAIGIGDACTVAYIRKLKQDNLSRDDIMRITGKKESWLRDEESLLTLDDECFDAFVEGEINRTIALELVEVREDQRHSELTQIKEFSLIRQQAKIQTAIEATKVAGDKVDLAMANVGTATTPEEKDAARVGLIAAQVHAEKKQKDLDLVQQQKPKANSKDGHAMMDKLPVMTLPRIKRHWETPLQEFLQAGDFTEIPERDARLFLRVCEGIKEGNHDIKSILIADQ